MHQKSLNFTLKAGELYGIYIMSQQGNLKIQPTPHSDTHTRTQKVGPRKVLIRVIKYKHLESNEIGTSMEIIRI